MRLARAGDGSLPGAPAGSLDRFFAASVRAQTAETAELLRRALEAAGPAAAGASAALADHGVEGFGRLLGLLRVNALSLQATPQEAAGVAAGASEEAGTPAPCVRGLAIPLRRGLRDEPRRGPELLRGERPRRAAEVLRAGCAGRLRGRRAVHRLPGGLPVRRVAAANILLHQYGIPVGG
ncbi:unnamed protein product [Prorocentrum cordatum]|uniref:Uncharacterized protein n=1 Tax=Prorocentrum cordatum TaxID=2364126 RepID=A0ABN9WGE1_9DINO|nr:unnamed protein product [Polarella glacialis]